MFVYKSAIQPRLSCLFMRTLWLTAPTENDICADVELLS